MKLMAANLSRIYSRIHIPQATVFWAETPRGLAVHCQLQRNLLDQFSRYEGAGIPLPPTADKYLPDYTM
jgi:hypothetical protein